MLVSTKKVKEAALHEVDELHGLKHTCDPSACERATDGPARHCLRGAGQEPSACNRRTEGHNRCCLPALPLVH